MTNLSPEHWTVEEFLVAWDDRGTYVSADEMYSAMLKVGRVPAPALLLYAYEEALLAEDALAELVADAWTGAEYPERSLGRDAWRLMFEATGYVLDARRGRSPRPTEPLTLYRGATLEHRSGWAWTADPDLAHRFAAGQMRGRGTGLVCVAEVEPWRLFCRCDGRQEQEYVIDTDCLDIAALATDSATDFPEAPPPPGRTRTQPSTGRED